MAKVALLVGVSEYLEGLNPLPGAVKDIEAMQRVLQHPEMGDFDDVKILSNPEPITMQEAIETLFSDRTKDELALLFFSGHGVKDESGLLYFATRLTRKNPKGDLVKATAVSAYFVQNIMSNSRCKRQVVILDCCFSGAFAEGMTAKDDGVVDVKTQLGGEGRAVLTSSTSTQYSFEQQEFDLSVYTRYIVEGIETGAADLDKDGLISVDNLHEYARKKVQEAVPAMKPKIYAVEEGFKIQVAKAPVDDPKLRYRRKVEQLANRGEISDLDRSTLNAFREQLSLSETEAVEIEAQVLKPYQDYQKKLQKYEDALRNAVQKKKSLSENTRIELKRFQEVLGLEDKDIESIELRVIPPTPPPKPLFSVKRVVVALALLGLVGTTIYLIIPGTSPPRTTQLSDPSIKIPDFLSPAARKLAEDLRDANITFSAPNYYKWLGENPNFNDYPTFAKGCLKLLGNRRFKQVLDLDKIYYNYVEERGGKVNRNAPDSNLDTKILKDAIVEAHNSSHPNNAQSFEDIVEQN
jgi:uncharacterized caspase-like protein